MSVKKDLIAKTKREKWKYSTQRVKEPGILALLLLFDDNDDVVICLDDKELRVSDRVTLRLWSTLKPISLRNQ